MPSKPIIETAYEAYCRACIRFWLMPGGPLGNGDVDHFPVSRDLFAAAFQSINPAELHAFPPTYEGLKSVITVLADQQPAGWKAMASIHGRNSVGVLLLAAMAESSPMDADFIGRLASELNGRKRAERLRNDLESLWIQLDEWVEDERTQKDSEYSSIRTLRLDTYAHKMTRIGTTVEVTFPNREDRQAIEPAIRELLGEQDPPVSAVVRALSRAARKAEPLLQRAIREFQEDPFHCRGVAGCLKAIVIQRIQEAGRDGAAGKSSGTGNGSSVDLLFYRQEDSLLVPCFATSAERDGYEPSEYLPEGWSHFRPSEGGSLALAGNLETEGIRPDVIRALARGSLGLKQVDANWFLAAGRVGADAQDAILIKEPPAELVGCSPAWIEGWKQWFKRDNGQISGLSTIRDQTGLLQDSASACFTGGVRLARNRQYLRVSGFGPRAALSHAAWWSAQPAAGGSAVLIPGQEVDAWTLEDGEWICACHDGMGKMLGSDRISLTSHLPLGSSFPSVAAGDRMERHHPGSDGLPPASSFIRQPAESDPGNGDADFDPLDETGKWYFDAVHTGMLTDERDHPQVASAFAGIRAARDDLLRVLIGRSCDRSTPVGWGAFADDLQIVMNRAIPEGRKGETFRHAGPIVRAWEEVGCIDIVNKAWAGLCVIPRTPRWTIVKRPDGRWRALATGLVSPHQRALLLRSLEEASLTTGAVIDVKHSINPYVPSIIQVDGLGDEGWILAPARDLGFAEAERMPSARVAMVLNGPGNLRRIAAECLSQPMDRNQYAEDPDARPPESIGPMLVQRTRAIGSPTRWFVWDKGNPPATGLMTTSRNWAYLLARCHAGIAKPVFGATGSAIPLREDMPDCFLPIDVARALVICGQRLPGPFTRATGGRFYGNPYSASRRRRLISAFT